MSRILVTGGAGFIGSHLVDALAERGHVVVVLDNFATGRRENLAAHERKSLRIIEGSILDRAVLARAMSGCDCVFHLAVECVRRSLGAPLGNHEINATGTLYALEAARAVGVKRFIYCSSSEIYGNSSSEPLIEDSAHPAPVTVYGAAKLAGEFYAHAYRQTYGLPTVVVRPFNAYGPREHESGDLAEVVPRFLIRVLNGLPPVVFGTGENGRDFTYVTDVARGLLLASECDSMVGQTVNIARGRLITIDEVAATVLRLCGREDLQPIRIEARPGDVIALHADATRARMLFGYEAMVGFEEGMGRYLAWFRAHHNDVHALLEENIRNWTMTPANNFA